MSDPAIEAAIPHRPPMLLVDEVVERTGDEIVCRKTFRADEFFFQGHFPGFAIVPGVILLECAIQAGAIMLASRLARQASVPVVTRIQDVRFKKMIRPGDQVELRARLIEQLQDVYFVEARVLSEGQTAVRFQFACKAAPAAG